MKLDNYECDGQMELTDFLKAKIVDKKVMDLTEWINAQGKAQYQQIGDVISKTCGDKVNEELINRLTNDVSVYVLNQSMGYMKYLRKESSV